MVKILHSRVFFFFFQAEDGIRDLTVTGVQTCTLPISTEDFLRSAVSWAESYHRSGVILLQRTSLVLNPLPDVTFKYLLDRVWLRGYARSEERRVGKECRCRLWQCH